MLLTLALVVLYTIGLGIRYFLKFIHEENWQYQVPFQLDVRLKHTWSVWSVWSIWSVWKYVYATAHLFLVYHQVYAFLVVILLDRVVNFKPDYFWNVYPVVLILWI